jgi:hypothetical protein
MEVYVCISDKLLQGGAEIQTHKMKFTTKWRKYIDTNKQHGRNPKTHTSNTSYFEINKPHKYTIRKQRNTAIK